MPASTPSAYRRDIEGLRALAVLLVIVHHVAPQVLPGGFVGVDVFFVISGFLMTRIIDNAMQAGTFSYSAFIWRRGRRIVPALVTVLVATLSVALCLLTGPELTNLARHLIAGSLSASNLLLWSEVGYFDTTAALKPLLHLWSLGVEEQFYLLWPLFLGAVPMAPRSRVLAMCALVALSLMVSESLAWSDPSQAFYMLHSRAWELGLGGVLALSTPVLSAPAADRTERSAVLRSAASLVGLTLILGAATQLDGAAAWPGLSALLPVVGTVMLLGAGPSAFTNLRVLSHGPAEWLGKRSYSLYLWHWPPLAFLSILAQEHAWSASFLQWSGVLLMLPVALLADLTYRFVERPAYTRASSVEQAGPIRARHLVAYAKPLGAVALLAAVLLQTHGLPIRYGTAGLDAVSTLRDASPDSIASYGNLATRCRLPDKGHATWCWRVAGQGRGVAVYGDSHAEAVFAGLAALGTDTPLFLTGRKGCAPIIQIVSGSDRTAEICRRASNLAHETIRADQSVGIVVMVSRGPAYMSGAGFGVDSQRAVVPIAPGDSVALKLAFEYGMERSIRSFIDANKRVVLVLDTPELGFLPEECLIGRPFKLRTIRTPCAVSRRVVSQRNREYRLLVARLQRRIPALEVFDTFPILCDTTQCDVVRAHRLLYSDANHLTMFGSRLVTRPLQEHLAQRDVARSSIPANKVPSARGQ